MHSGPLGKSELCAHREPTGRVIIVIVAEREEKREEKEKEKKKEKEKEKEKENDGREKERRKREREKGREREENLPPSLLPVCRFKTSPCVGSKRFRVYRQNARMCSTCARVARTHGSVLNQHTDAF